MLRNFIFILFFYMFGYANDISYTCDNIEELAIQETANNLISECKEQGINMSDDIAMQFVYKNPNFSSFKKLFTICTNSCRNTESCVKSILKVFKKSLKDDSNQSSQEKRDDCIGIIENIYAIDSINTKGLTKDEKLFFDGIKMYKNQEYESAISYFDKALNFKLKNNKYNKIYTYLGMTYNEIGDYSNALYYYKKALNNTPSLLNKASLKNNIAEIYSTIGKYNEALAFYKESLAVKKNIFTENNIYLIETYINMGLLYSRIGNYSEAFQYLQIALKMEKKSPQMTSTIYTNLGYAYQQIGDLPKSLNYYQKALSIRKKTLKPNHTDIGLSYNNIGLTYYELGIYSKALEYYQKALQIYKNSLKRETHIFVSTVYNNIGLVYQDTKHYQQAIKYYKKALKISQQILGIKHIETTYIYNNLGMLYKEIGDYSKALKYLKQTLTINREILGENHVLTALAYNNMGILYSSLQKHSKSLEFYKKALTIKEKILGKQSFDTIHEYNNIASVYSEIENYKKAYEYSLLSFNISEKSRKYNFSVLNKNEKQKYLKKYRLYLSNMFEFAFSYGQEIVIGTTFNSWLNYKRTIFDEENKFKLLYQKTKDKNIKFKIEELDKTRKKLALLYQNIPKDNKKLKNHLAYIKTVKESISDIEKFLSSKVSNFEFKKISYKDISKHIKPNELYIDFAKMKNNYFCFIVDDKNNIGFIKFSQKDSEEIDKTITTIKNTTNTYIKEAKKNYRKLYKLIFEHHNINVNGHSSLIISPDGLLNTIPFEAFYDGKNYLIEKLNIRYIPSGKEFVKLYKNSSTSNDKVIVFANPLFGLEQNNQNRSQLKGTTIEKLYKEGTHFENLKTDESKIIKRLYGAKSKIYKGDQATETNFFKIKSPKILHLSTHGFYLKDKTILNPMLKAGIALSGANESIKHKKGDGIVTALELSGMDLSHTELVVLSACETGVGELTDGEGVAGINKAFMKAGAKYVIMSLWSVPTYSTEKLMTKFYENLQKGQSYSEALRGAKIWWIKHNHSHPYFWAGFVGSGMD